MVQFGVGYAPVHIADALSRAAQAPQGVVRDGQASTEGRTSARPSHATSRAQDGDALEPVGERRRLRTAPALADARVRKLLDEQLSIEEESAFEAGAVGYMPHALSMATMPHSKCDQHVFERRNGNLVLSMHAPSSIGLPYGTKPRLILAFITSQAKIRGSRDIELGRSLAEFMRALGLSSTGGKNGSITGLKDQLTRLFSTSITCVRNLPDSTAVKNWPIVSKADLWWDPKEPDQPALWESTIRLGEDFFNDICEKAIPVDVRALRVLKRSPMALDIYVWLTYRMSYLNHQGARIPWPSLKMQFGCGYAETVQGTNDFKKRFCRHLSEVLAVYPRARVEEASNALILRPSPTHVRRSTR